MKKILKGYLLGFLSTVILFGSITVFATTKTATLYDVVVDGIRIVLDGKEFVCTDANGAVVQPMIYNGTTYIPVRAVSSAFGKAVYWDGENQTVYLGNMDGKLEHPTLKLEDSENIAGWGSSLYEEKNIFDNYGNFYENCVCYKNSLSKEFANDCCEVLLNEKYSKFKATLFVPEGSNWEGESSIRIIGDGKLLYKNVMDKTSKPVDVEIPISGVNNFKIIFGDEAETYIANAGFYQ